MTRASSRHCTMVDASLLTIEYEYVRVHIEKNENEKKKTPKKNPYNLQDICICQHIVLLWIKVSKPDSPSSHQTPTKSPEIDHWNWDGFEVQGSDKRLKSTVPCTLLSMTLLNGLACTIYPTLPLLLTRAPQCSHGKRCTLAIGTYCRPSTRKDFFSPTSEECYVTLVGECVMCGKQASL